MALHTTALSTTETDHLIDLLMPAAHARLLKKACNTYSKAKVKAAHARDKHTQYLQRMVHDVIHIKRPRLEKEPRHKWTALLMAHYARHGIKIDEETVRKHVKTFPGF